MTCPCPLDVHGLDQLGRLAWLCMHVPAWHGVAVESVVGKLVPAIQTGQFVTIHRAGFPVAFATWSSLSSDLDVTCPPSAGMPGPTDAASAPRLWLLDWHAPFSLVDAKSLHAALSRRVGSAPTGLWRTTRGPAGIKAVRSRTKTLQTSLSNTAITGRADICADVRAVCPPGFMEPPFRLLGQLLWLWSQSPLHASWELDSAMRFLLPAAGTGQVELLTEGGLPRAYCSWAWLDRDGEARYIANPSSLPLLDWDAGERLWIIDWVAPFGAADSWTLRRRMLRRFRGQQVSALRVYPDRRRSHRVCLGATVRKHKAQEAD